MKSALPFLALILLVGISAVRADEDDGPTTRSARLERIKQQLTRQEYLLRYRFAEGETIRYRVEHLATVETRMQGTVQTTKSRSVSTKNWQVSQVGDDQSMTFVHSVDDVDMWSKVSGRQAIGYNSREDETPPPEYETIAKSIGIPLTKVTMDQRGKIIRREDELSQINLGMGGLAMPLPLDAITEGYTWATPYQLRVKLKDGRYKSIKVRKLYRLEKVETQVATISVSTQVLTPLNDPRVRSQLIQRLSHGEIKFDLDAGRILSKQLDWDETVIGFNGADSNMKYLARFSEELIPATTEDQASPPATTEDQASPPATAAKESPAKG